MNRNAKDPDLNVLANELRTLAWVNPLSWEEEKLLTDCAMTTVGRVRRHVTLLPGYRDVAVRLHLAQAQRTLGIASIDQLPQALRFADMAMMVFWKYRWRGAAPPTTLQLNRMIKDVEEDMQVEVNALDLLRRIEKYLLEAGIIKAGSERPKVSRTIPRTFAHWFTAITLSCSNGSMG